MATTSGRRGAVLLCAAVCLLTGGCRKRAVVPTLPAPPLATPVVKPPPPESPSMEAPPPESITHAPPVKVVEKKPVRRARRAAKAAVVPATPASATEMAAVSPPAAPTSTVLGELTTGGEASPRTQQEAAELIASGERRLQAVAATKAREQVAQLKEVRRFLDQAKEVLATGDAEGAKTLATKAKVLIDDLENWAAK